MLLKEGKPSFFVQLQVNNGALIPFIRTTGGGGVNIARVSTLSALTEAVYGDAKKTVILTGTTSVLP
jgi:hypothetical protein